MTDELLEFTNKVFHANHFTSARIREWVIWAARWQRCPECGVDPYQPCLNMYDVRRNLDEKRINRWPHPPRVDRGRLLGGLRHRGYYTGPEQPGEKKWDSPTPSKSSRTRTKSKR